MEKRFQHYVPRGYLEAWENGYKRIIACSLEETRFFLARTDEFLGENNFYTLNAETILALDVEELKEVFQSIDAYEVKLDGKVIKEYLDFGRYYYRFDEWIIYSRKDGVIVDNDRVNQKIKKQRILSIENGWEIVENDWSKIREYILNYANATKKKFSIEKTGEIIKFIAVQRARVLSMKEKFYDVTESTLNDLNLMGKWTEEQRNEVIKKFGEASFLDEMKKYQRGEYGVIAQLEERLSHLNFVTIYYAPNNLSFYTSDNPVLISIRVDIRKNNYKEITLPISPKCVIGLSFREKSGDRIIRLSEEKVKETNASIIRNAYKYYVTTEMEYRRIKEDK